jgi:hypothetical protein
MDYASVIIFFRREKIRHLLNEARNLKILTSLFFVLN